jgi:hypothetical protein
MIGRYLFEIIPKTILSCLYAQINLYVPNMQIRHATTLKVKRKHYAYKHKK